MSNIEANRRAFLAATTLASLGGSPDRLAAAGPGPDVQSSGLRIVNLRELESRAEAVLPRGPFDYIAGGAGDEWTKAENEAAFKRMTIVPRFLGDHRPVDTTTSLLGTKVSCPIFVCPMGGQGLAHSSAEVGTAKGAAEEGALMTVSAMSTLPLEVIASASAGPKWFHYYVPEDRGQGRELLQRAKAAGYRAVIFGVDSSVGPNRERNVRNNFDVSREPVGNFTGPYRLKLDLGWDDIAFVQKESGLPVVLKGVMSEVIASRAVASGLAGIQISNHGGRALDDSPATITVLPRLAAAVDGRGLVLLDGGVRRGQDVFKALALGADAVGIGRPVLYGLALGGAAGVRAVLAHLKLELEFTLRSCATPTLSDINPTYLQMAERLH